MLTPQAKIRRTKMLLIGKIDRLLAVRGQGASGLVPSAYSENHLRNILASMRQQF